MKNGFFVNTISLVNRFLRFYHSFIETVKLNDIRNNECTYLRFDVTSSKLGTVDCDPRWLKFLICCLERDRRQGIFNQDYFKLSQLINLKGVIDTVENL